MAHRNPSFKPTDNPVQMTLAGPIIKRSGDPLTYEDPENGRVSYLHTLVDDGGNEYTYFASGHQAKMLEECVAPGGIFMISKYGRAGSNGRFFGDIKIEVDGVEYLGETFDEGPNTAPSFAGGKSTPDASTSKPNTPPAHRKVPEQRRQDGNGSQAAQVSKGRQAGNQVDDVGMMAECMADASRLLFSDQLAKVYKQIGTTPSIEDVCTRAASLFIGRQQRGEKQPRREAYISSNFTFDNLKAPDPPAPPESDEPEESEF